MIIRRTLAGFIVCLVGLGLQASYGHDKAFLDAQTIHDRWKANCTGFKSLRFKCARTLLVPEGSASGNLVQFSYLERIQDGQCFLVRYTNARGSPEDVNSGNLGVTSFDGRFRKRYEPWSGRGQIGREPTHKSFVQEKTMALVYDEAAGEFRQVSPVPVRSTASPTKKPATAAQPQGMLRCAGKVVGPNGHPIAGAHVTLYQEVLEDLAGTASLRRLGELTTGPDASFTFATQPRSEESGFYGYVTATGGGLSLGWTVWDMRVDLARDIHLGTPQQIDGTVVDESGAPVAGAQVRVVLFSAKTPAGGDHEWECLFGVSPLEELGTCTDDQGKFHFGDIPADSGVDLLVTSAGRAMTYTCQGPNPSFKAGQTDIRVVVPIEGRIEGRVVDSNTNLPIPANQLAIIPYFSGVGWYRCLTTTDQDGGFRAGELRAGRYLIRGRRMPQIDVEVMAGQTTRLTLRVDRPWYGRVLFADGSPAVVKPPVRGKRAYVFLSPPGTYDGMVVLGAVDEEGYFEIWLSEEQLGQLRSNERVLTANVYLGQRDGVDRWWSTTFAVEVLSRERSKAGVVTASQFKPEPVPLGGRPLPALVGIDLDVNDIQMKGKIVLLCFLDVQQRPSRNTGLELLRRAEMLNQHGVVLLAVQASRIDGASLREWIKENGVSFPVGMIQGDEDKTWFAWGVKALPWLILTDKEHVVRAEGFAASELDALLGK